MNIQLQILKTSFKSKHIIFIHLRTQSMNKIEDILAFVSASGGVAMVSSSTGRDPSTLTRDPSSDTPLHVKDEE